MLIENLIFGKEINIYTEIENWQKENSNIPIFIWGTGSVAVGVYKNIHKYQILISGFFYDTDYVIVDPRLTDESENVFSLNEIVKNYNKFAVIMGHSKYELAAKMNQLDNVVKIWSITGVIRPGIKLDEIFIKENIEAFEYSYSKLSDDLSKRNMITYLNSHLMNDATEIINNFTETMNFFENDIFHLSNNEVYCDCGAYDGNSAKCFLNTVQNNYKKMFLIEVMKDMYDQLCTMHELSGSNITISNLGISDHVGEDTFSFDSQSTCLSEEGVKVPVITLDELLKDEHVTLIKIAIGDRIDKILAGAQTIIHRDLPKLAIMVGVDKYALLNYISIIEKYSGSKNYEFYLRYTSANPDCLTLFVIPHKKEEN